MKLIAKNFNGVAPKTLKVAMHLASKGDHKAFNTIYNAFHDKLFWFFLDKKKLNKEAAEDLAIEVIGKVWEKSSKYDPIKSNLSTWIYTIAENHYIDYRRKEQSRISYFPIYKVLFTDSKVDPTAFKVCKQDSNPEQKMIMSELKDFISTLLSTKVLNEKLSEIMELRYIDELSLKEVEKKLKINSSTLRVHVMRAKKEIKEYINANFSISNQHAIIPLFSMCS